MLFMKYQSLFTALGIILGLMLVLMIAVYFNQAEVIPADDASYYETPAGDEYLDYDYVSPDEEGIGDFYVPEEREFEPLPTNMSDCESKKGFDMEWCYSKYAELSGDESGCDAIEDLAIRDDCFLKMSQTNADPALCEKIVVGKAQCYIDVAIETNMASLCEKGKVEKEMCIKAANAGSFDLCSKDFQRDICDEAVTNRDPSFCDNMLDYSNYCYSTIAINTNQSSLCNKLEYGKDTCFFKIAIALNNAKICENLSETRDNCIAWVAFNTNNKELCYQAGTEVQSCLADLA